MRTSVFFACPKNHRYFLLHPRRQKFAMKTRCFNPDLLENGRLFDKLRFSGVFKMASLIEEDAVDPGVFKKTTVRSH
jgi:hypothetical protein